MQSLKLEDRALELIPHACLVKGQALYPTLKRAERAALEYLFAHAGVIADASIVTVARDAGCSEATLFRLARRLGYEGFPALKADFAGGQQSGGEVIYKGISAADDPLSVLDKVFTASIQSLRDTLAILDKEQFGRAVDAVRGARRILFCGTGDASQVATAAAQKFARVDIDARASDDPDTQLIMASHLKAGDVVVGISHSGRTLTILNTIREAVARGATAIAVTNFPVSPLAKACPIILLTADFAEHLNGEVVSKRVSEHCILESLYISALIARNGELIAAHQRADSAVRVYKA